MGNPATFWPEALPWAVQAHAQTGVLTSVVLAQWAIETGYGGADWSPNNNPGNVGSFDGKPVARFPNLAEGVAAYIQLMNAANRPQFGAAIRRLSTYQAQASQLGNANPVWASSRYALPGGAPGSEIVYVIGHYGLTRFDGAAPAPGPAPTPAPVPTPTPAPPIPSPTAQESVYMIPSNCNDAGALRAQIREWWTTYRSDVMTLNDSNLFALVFTEPVTSRGYGGDPDLLLAGIIDDATTKGAVRPQFVNAV